MKGSASAAAILAKCHRIGQQEAAHILDAFKRSKRNEDGGLDLHEFKELLCGIFDVPDVTDNILESAYEAMGCEKEVHIGRFLSWYVRNMFSLVNALNANPKDTQGNSDSYSLADKLGVPVRTLDAIQCKFDRFDVGKSGKIGFEEFVGVMNSLLRAKKEEICEARLRKFWREIPEVIGGTVTFEAFARWYTLVFSEPSAHKSTLPLEVMYSTFSPTFQRSVYLDSHGAKLSGRSIA